jgi:hypothetical protein
MHLVVLYTKISIDSLHIELKAVGQISDFDCETVGSAQPNQLLPKRCFGMV